MKGLGQDSYDSSRMKGKDDKLSSRTGLFAEQERRDLSYAILEVHQD